MFEAKEPFIFHSQLHLIELTGLIARNLSELLEHIKTVNGSCIYQHTHHFIQQHQHLSPEPTNDFAYWVKESLGDPMLGEELDSFDIMARPTIRSIREGLVGIIEGALSTRPRLKLLIVPEGEEFSFLKSVSFVFPTPHIANDLVSFANCVRDISINSIYFHMFESRLRLGRPTNDFSNWLSSSLDEGKLALKIAQLDPYTRTGENLRSKIIDLVTVRIMEESNNAGAQ